MLQDYPSIRDAFFVSPAGHRRYPKTVQPKRKPEIGFPSAWPVADGRLVALDIEDDPTEAGGLTIYAAQRRDRVQGPAGRWLLERLRQRLTNG